MDKEINVTVDATEIGNTFVAHKMLIQLLYAMLVKRQPADAQYIKDIALKVAWEAEESGQAKFSATLRELVDGFDPGTKPVLVVIEGGTPQGSRGS